MRSHQRIGSVRAALALGAALALAPALVEAQSDFGAQSEKLLALQSIKLFGVLRPVGASSTESIDAATAHRDPRKLVTLALGLKANVVAAHANVPPNIDMMVLWPNDVAPTHIIACNEEGTAQPGVVRIRLDDGRVETMISGLSSCDPVRRTAWGTLIVGEEAGDTGHVLEVMNPLSVTNVVFDRTSGDASNGPFGGGAEKVADRPALGRLSFEGIGLYPNGVMYYGDENRPSQGTPGGAYFKFIPSAPWLGGSLANLDDSPLADGRVYGLRLGKRSGNTDYGQGSNTGLGTWVEVNPVGDLRAAAADLRLTGYYRPEDIDIDGAALADGSVRFCGNNTGNEGNDDNWGESICITDGTLEEATAGSSTPELQLFVPGTPDLAMMDNMAYQPGRGNWVLLEDGDGPEVGRNNDIWACLPDGADGDRRSDGCIKIATLNDLNAESTGGFFDATGKHFFVSIQHNVTGHGVILDISGWK